MHWVMHPSLRLSFPDICLRPDLMSRMHATRSLIVGTLMILISVPASSADNVKHGEQIYNRCMACHALTYDRVGPRHCGLIGRRAGSVPGFSYSTAMKNIGWIWNKRTLNRFLANPTKVIPGTSMTYDGIKNKQERMDLIAYLEWVDKSAECEKN